MNSFYIYSFSYKVKSSDVSATVIYCSCDDIDEGDLQSEIRDFYELHYQTDEVFVIASNLNLPRLDEVFIKNQNETFRGIPKRQETFFRDSLYLLSFDKNGEINCHNNKQIPDVFIKTFVNQGLQWIFKARGGLITSEASHHYVFPSGKHCDRFLRTGNILLYSPEIFFIAFSLLKHFNEEDYTRIYCDTSSINSIGFALFHLKNSFLAKKIKVSVESFSSYDGLYKKEYPYTKDSFLLISASTSSNIIKYILDQHNIIDRDNIIILYFLGKDSDYSNVKDQVLCNLTQSNINENGISFYPTYTEHNCEFCQRGSYAVPVAGDVFLLEKPKINKILLAVKDRDKSLSDFVLQFKSKNRNNSIFKVNYKEDSDNKYEIYIDYKQILNNINSKLSYLKYKEKLNNYIQQYIPSRTKYILYLPDQGSEILAKFILEKIAKNYKKHALPVLLNQDMLQTIDISVESSIVIVGSCISNGKNLLYLSRALRKFDKLKIIYFIGIVRTQNADYLSDLKSNLKRGRYGPDTNGFIAIETMFCRNNSKSSPWMIELNFLKEIILFIESNQPQFKESKEYFEKRKTIILEKSGNKVGGLTEDLFFERITTKNPETLRLRKNFAFWNFDDYDKDVTQSDVYFTISNIINSLRNSSDINRQLKQSIYVRNILDPSNFNRFNDGIIQASILRSASETELAYGIDQTISEDMYNTLETIIMYHEQEQGEALLEFLYAIAIKKLSLANNHLLALLNNINANCKKELFKSFSEFIKFKLIDEPETLRNTPLTPLTIVKSKKNEY